MKFTSYVRLDPNVKLIFGFKGVKLKVHTNALKFFRKRLGFLWGSLLANGSNFEHISFTHHLFSGVKN